MTNELETPAYYAHAAARHANAADRLLKTPGDTETADAHAHAQTSLAFTALAALVATQQKHRAPDDLDPF